MFQSRTLFVVGAGASCEFGLPSGEALKGEIANLLNLEFDNIAGRFTGDGVLIEALHHHARLQQKSSPGLFNQYVQRSRIIKGAMPAASSIDYFLDAHRGDEIMEVCGKLGIVRAVLNAEKGSRLFVDNAKEQQLDIGRIDGTWINRFMQLATDGVPKSDVASVFANVAIITFNYDRCIEHGLAHWLARFYALEPPEAETIVSTIEILHPYGVVGQLPWKDKSASGVGFGASIGPLELLAASKQVKTFTERIEEKTILEGIRYLSSNAEVVVYLGFAFHPQNMTLLRPTTEPKARRVFATAYGLSRSDRNVVVGQINDSYPGLEAGGLELETNLKCVDLFSEYSRSLTTPYGVRHAVEALSLNGKLESTSG